MRIASTLFPVSRLTRPVLCTLALGGIALAGCADDGAAMATDGQGPGTWEDSGSGRPGDGEQDAGWAGEPDVAEPEPEPELKLAPPASNRRYVYIASRSTNTVARVDSVTLAVAPIRVGREPTEVRTVAEGNLALVLNVGDATVSVIRSTPSSDDVASVDVLSGCNELDLADNGRWAVAWYNNRAAEAGDPIGSLQEVSVIDVDANDAYTVSVGFTVRDVVFDLDAQRIYVVTDSGVNVVDLATLDGDIAVPTVGIGDDPLAGTADREVQIARGTGIAVVRSTTSAELRLVSLDDGAIERIELTTVPTDLDLLADGRTAVVALRDADLVALVDIVDAAGGDDGIRLIEVDGVSPGVVTLLDAGRALTFRTSQDDARVGLLDLADGVQDAAWTLRKGIVAASGTPQPGRALLVHRAGTGAVVAGEAIGDVIDRASAVTLLDLNTGYAKLTLLDDDPDDFVFAPDGSAAFLMLANPARGVQSIERIDLNTFATHTFRLDSEPEAIGVVPDANRIWVSQASSLGRITFIDIATGAVHEISGYQLNAFIE